MTKNVAIIATCLAALAACAADPNSGGAGAPDGAPPCFPTSDVEADGAAADPPPDVGPDLLHVRPDAEPDGQEPEPDTGKPPVIGPKTPTPCDQPGFSPGPEFCNGIDDDCDGQVDDHVICTDFNPCTLDVCYSPEGKCVSVNKPKNTPCGANGVCFEGVCTGDVGCGDGVCATGETCGNCDVDCGPCDKPLCGDDECSIDESCATCAMDCGSCDSACFGTTCDDGDPCTVGDECIGGACYGGLTELTCNLAGDCKQGYCEPFVGCLYDPVLDGAPCGDGDTCANGMCLPKSLEAGDIIITEIMVNPTMVTDANGEWFEVYNTSESDIDINGWKISDDKSEHIITSQWPVLVAAQTYAVLTKKGNPTDNGGIVPDYSYQSTSDSPSTFMVNNDHDSLTLTAQSMLIDKVSYHIDFAWPVAPGVSMQLSSESLDGAANDAPLNWCMGTAVYGAGDQGSPGWPNQACW